MAEVWVNRNVGSDAGAGTKEDPWFTVPGISGANAVSAGDIINVMNGTVNYGRLILPANDLTYRGYGIAANVLWLELPKPNDPSQLYLKRVVRQEGVHEGMWVLDGAGVTLQGVLNFSVRTGCVVEDICIVNALESSAAVSIGASSQSQAGATMRRFFIDGAKQGIANYRPDTLIEDGVIRDTLDDGIVIGTGATQSFHAGRFNTLRRLNLIDNGTDEVAGIGDPVQLLNSSGYQGTLRLTESLIRRNSPVKQGFMMASVAGSVYVEGNYFDGQQTGSVQVGIESVKTGGQVIVRRNYWKQVQSNGNPYVRLVDGSNNFEDGGSILVELNVVDADIHAGLFSWGPFLQTIAGSVTVRRNTIRGYAHNGLSWSAVIGAQTAGTIAATASMTVEDNLMIGNSPVAVRLPTGGLNDARWTVRGNLAFGVTNFAAVGAAGFQTAFATVSLFEASHAGSVGNSQEDPKTVGYGLPLPSSPVLYAGVSSAKSKDFRKSSASNFIGAIASPVGAVMLHYLIVEKGAVAPTPQQIVNGVTYGAVTVLDSGSVGMLSAAGFIDAYPVDAAINGTTYDQWWVAFDGNEYGFPVKGEVTAVGSVLIPTLSLAQVINIMANSVTPQVTLTF